MITGGGAAAEGETEPSYEEEEREENWESLMEKNGWSGRLQQEEVTLVV